MRILLAVLNLLFFVLPCFAQNMLLKGTAKDAETGSCISFANVIAFTMPDSVPVGFSVTDENGIFSIEVSRHEHLLLRTTCVGYKEVEKVVTPSNAEHLDILMHEDSKMLSTVTVNGRKLGIKVSGDTIDYNFSKYTDGSEKVLKDILAKLPGMDVDEKGQVTANGKSVKKILVNGQDFFGDHNEQITNNLPSNYVDKIQLLKNYSEYSFLKGFNTSKTQALNVNIDSLHSGNLTGNTEVVAGYRDRYRISAGVYSFGSQAMWSVNVKLYNTGEEMMSLLDYIKLQGSVTDYARSFGGAACIIDDGISTGSFIETDISTYQRRNALMSANVAWNPSEKIKVNAYYLFNSEDSKGEYSIFRKYHGFDDSEQIFQLDDTRKRFHHLGLNTKIALNDNAALNFRTKLTVMPQNVNSDLGNLQSVWNNTAWNLCQQISFVKNWDNKNLLSITEQFMYHHLDSETSIASDSTSLYGTDTLLFKVDQNIRSAKLSNNLMGSWISKVSRDWQLRTAIIWEHSYTSIEASSKFQPFIIPSQTDNTNLLACGVAAQKKSGLLHLDAGMDFAYIVRNNSDSWLSLLPKVSLELALNSINSITLSYKSGYKKDDNYFMHGQIINDYRRITCYGGEQNLLHRNHDLSLSVNYFDILYDFTFITSAGCIITENPYIMSFDNNRDRTLVSIVSSGHNGSTQYAYFNIKKGFRFPLILAIKSTLSNSLYESAYSGIVSKNRFSKADGEITLTSKMKSLVNVEIGGRLSFEQSKSGVDGNRLNMVSWETWLRPFLVKKNKYDLSIPISYINDRVSGVGYHYMNCSLTASWHTGSWTFTMESKNIFHSRSFRRICINMKNDYTETITEYRMPGHIIAGAKYSF